MITPSKCANIARVKKQNEIIAALNPLLRIELREGDKLQTHYSDNNVVLEIPESSSGVPYGYEEVAVNLCIGGVVTPGSVLFKAD
tara:strand:- start:107 stop:361 length:255 start_codon:yes stop_codon:yes gene_type:complete